MQQSENIGSLVAAMAKAQLEVRNPALDRAHPHFKGFRYASLGAHLDAIREPFARHGLIVTQGVESSDKGVSVTTMIAHGSGEWMRSSVGMDLPERATAQNLGAIVTYLRRYAIASIALLTGDDDTDADEDRIARAPQPAAKPAQAPAKPAAAPQPVAAPKPAATASALFATTPVGDAPVKRGVALKPWGDAGADIVRVERIVDRDNGVSAVLCSHATEGQVWVSVPVHMIGAAKVGKTVDLAWAWNAAGFYEATRLSPAPTMSDMGGAK